MEDLAKFFADIIEFIVGGVLFLASLLVVVNAIDDGVLSDLRHDLDSAPAGLGGGYTVAALALVYAMGIVAEGVSRRLFEWRLDRITEGVFPESGDPVVVREQQRLRVKHVSEKLDGAVNAQLKRLRIERTLALSSAVATLGLLFTPSWWFAAFLVLTVVAAWLVEERFNRYVKTIRDAYGALLPDASAGALE